MSYDLGLYYDGIPAVVARHAEGGTYAVGGIMAAELTITYNYSRYYKDQLDAEQGIRWLYGKTGGATISRLEDAVAFLGTTQDTDYWKITAGNAGYALSILLTWANEHPNAVWDGD